MQCLEDVVPGRRPLRGSISRRYDSDGKCSDQQPIPLLNPVRADLAELLDWVEGVSTAAQQARDKGNITLASRLVTHGVLVLPSSGCGQQTYLLLAT